MNNLRRNFTRNLQSVAQTEQRILELLVVGFSEVNNGNLDYLKASLSPFMTPKSNELNAQGKRIVNYIHSVFGHAVRIKTEKKPQATGFTVAGQQVLSPVSVRLVPAKRRGDVTKIMVNDRELGIKLSNLPPLDYKNTTSTAERKPSKITAKRLEAILAGIAENDYSTDELKELVAVFADIMTAIGTHSGGIVAAVSEEHAPFALTSDITGERQAIAH